MLGGASTCLTTVRMRLSVLKSVQGGVFVKETGLAFLETFLPQGYTAAEADYYNKDARAAIWVDYNRDNRLDLLIGGKSDDVGDRSPDPSRIPHAVLWKNMGGGTFTKQTAFSAISRDIYDLRAYDFDGDGDDDVLVAQAGVSELHGPWL